MTFGHELSGVIDKVGPKAEALGYHVGDKVIAQLRKYCYACDNCRSGHENLCSHVQFCMNGFAEYAVYHVTQVHKLPENYDLETAALIEPLTIALAAAEQAHISYGKSVAIMGAGGIGLMLVQLAVWRARPVSRSLTLSKRSVNWPSSSAQTMRLTRARKARSKRR